VTVSSIAVTSARRRAAAGSGLRVRQLEPGQLPAVCAPLVAETQAEYDLPVDPGTLTGYGDVLIAKSAAFALSVVIGGVTAIGCHARQSSSEPTYCDSPPRAQGRAFRRFGNIRLDAGKLLSSLKG
jgi:hypothetical protein